MAGPWWWQGPDFKSKHEIYPATKTFRLPLGEQTSVAVPGFEGGLGSRNTYSDNFFSFPYDFNSDGWMDVLVIGFPGKETSWFENPKGVEKHWARHVIFDQTDNESPTFTDLTGDGRPELVCITKGAYGFATPDWSDPAKPWTWHRLSANKGYGNFTHGMGVGDVNGDGRTDLIEKEGWFEQPASLGADPEWTHHAFPFAGPGGAQMYAYDVNGDGLNDVITSLAAHGFGLAWYEQVKNGAERTFKQHLIIGSRPADSRYGVKFSEPHAIDLIDMDGDGLKDIVTGKRFWSHGRIGDPDRNDEAVSYWFRLVRGPDGVDWVPIASTTNPVSGTQVVAGDVNGDKLPDVVVGNKKGVFVLLQQAKLVSTTEWQAAQPQPLDPPKVPADLKPTGPDGKPLDFGFEPGRSQTGKPPAPPSMPCLSRAMLSPAVALTCERPPWRVLGREFRNPRRSRDWHADKRGLSGHAAVRQFPDRRRVDSTNTRRGRQRREWSSPLPGNRSRQRRNETRLPRPSPLPRCQHPAPPRR